MSEHTSKQWHVGGVGDLFIKDERERVVAAAYIANFAVNEGQANARLIAAAPELLDICIRFIDVLAGKGMAGVIDTDELERVMDDSYGIVNKARGKE